MYTYIMKSHDLYKIGKTGNVESRLKTLKIGNPWIELIKIIEGNYEDILHKYYKDKRQTGEWFNLVESDIINIDDVVKGAAEKIKKDNEEISRRRKELFKESSKIVDNYIEKAKTTGVRYKDSILKLVERPKARLWYDDVQDEWKSELIEYKE